MLVEAIEKGQRWINIKGFKLKINGSVAVFMIYGPHTAENIGASWGGLVHMKNSLNILLIVLGDFNEIKSKEERLGCTCTSRTMGEFASWIDKLGLIDVPFLGCKFTWRRGKSFNRLDRVLMSPIWLEKYEELKLWGLKCSLSHHVPLLVEFGQKNGVQDLSVISIVGFHI